MIAEQSIEALKNQLDIIEVVSHYIELKKIGATFKACCPFHQEKTPSFVVNQNKGFYHCFGCGASGDSIAFVMQYEKLNYKEAIEKLAQLYNFTLIYEKDKNSFQEDSYRIMEFMREYYQNSLTKEVESYIQSRGITLSTQQKFELGYAGQNYEIMATLQKHSINLQEALNLGILGVDNENGAKRYYARLTQRLIFPIRSSQNKIVGFGGRTLGNHPAKYINSPQTKLFNKSQILYGYPQAKETIYKKEEVIVTEGYLDVIMLHQAGFTNAVATLGTALTKEHLPLLSKGNPKVILAYDGDNAGMNAAFKAASLLSLANKEGGVVLFDGGLDPADMVKNGDIARLKELFLTSIPFINFVLEWIIKKYDLDNPLQKDKCLQEALEYLQHFSLVIQEDYKGFLAQRLKLPSHLIRIKKNNQKEQIKEPIQSDGSFDLAEKAIIKSVLEDMNLLEFVMDFLEPTMFFSQKEAYLKLLKGELEDPSLIRILLDNKVKAQDKEKLKQQMIMILYQYYEEQKQKVINEKQLSLREKSFLIRKYQKYLDNLKKGDLIVYEGFSAF